MRLTLITLMALAVLGCKPTIIGGDPVLRPPQLEVVSVRYSEQVKFLQSYLKQIIDAFDTGAINQTELYLSLQGATYYRLAIDVASMSKAARKLRTDMVTNLQAIAARKERVK